VASLGLAREECIAIAGLDLRLREQIGLDE